MKKRIWRERKEENVKDEIIIREREGKKEKCEEVKTERIDIDMLT